MRHQNAQFQNTPEPRRPYQRSMQWWWLKDRTYRIYMLRELTAVAVAMFCFEVLAGLISLGNGGSAWIAWLGFLAYPCTLTLNVVALGLLVFHAWSWFDIMPKTIPPVIVGGHRVSDALISRSGHAVFIAVSVAAILLAIW